MIAKYFIFRTAVFLLALVSLFLVPLGLTGDAHANYMHSPGNGSTVSTNRPLIRFSLPPAIDYSSFRMTVNGADITSLAIRTPGAVIYTPSSSLPSGQNLVEVAFNGLSGTRERITWTFVVNAESLIRQVEHNATSDLVLGETVKVTVHGKPGCRGHFDLNHLRQGIRLTEESPGVYRGEYTILPGDRVLKGYVTAYLEDPAGNTDRKLSDLPLTIDARFFRVKITNPGNLTKVGRIFVVSGRTSPNVTVYLVSKLGLRSGFSPAPGSAATRKVDSDEHGFFTYEYYFPVLLKGLQATIMVYAIDDQGNRSIPDQVVVYVEGEEQVVEDASSSKD